MALESIGSVATRPLRAALQSLWNRCGCTTEITDSSTRLRVVLGSSKDELTGKKHWEILGGLCALCVETFFFRKLFRTRHGWKEPQMEGARDGRSQR
jgi:hypothetical protein